MEQISYFITNVLEKFKQSLGIFAHFWLFKNKKNVYPEISRNTLLWNDFGNVTQFFNLNHPSIQ